MSNKNHFKILTLLVLSAKQKEGKSQLVSMPAFGKLGRVDSTVGHVLQNLYKKIKDFWGN